MCCSKMGILLMVVYNSLLLLYYIHIVCKPYHRKGKQICTVTKYTFPRDHGHAEPPETSGHLPTVCPCQPGL